MDFETVLPMTSLPDKTVNDLSKELLESSACGCDNCSCKD